ncbi:YbaB/EbfC family nucleoid-associated protein [Streptomyces sp. NEAU-W12]|uniref:YbaB/EbfC family nucleoid-associated protein n=1 Tax=Streptomyces sp. NEAU-W12 TaxID=2994668 RepID=UPI00224A5C6D|nr:YbaB/EbfC family nucleoid-associated protein [Streptomyces sp. NEAU-W12]MCX2923463.1 YbaB/EbfC family nucleoid-associated protein [Streptomyces sp. NEAU-W12]
MSDSLEDRIARTTAEVEQLEKDVVTAQAQLEGARHTAHSSDRSMQVTVNGRGELIAAEFLDGKYRTMAAAQLSAALLEAVTAARAAMARAAVEMLDPVTRRAPAGSPRQVRGVDWSQVFGSLLDDDLGQQPRRSSRFRDEIHEDDDVPAATPGESVGDWQRPKDGV